MNPATTKPKIVYLLSHPIQYFSPLFVELTEKGVEPHVLYCTDVTLKKEASIDKQFGVPVKWDIPLLDGYSYQFLKNRGVGTPLYGFFSIVNPAIISALYKNRNRKTRQFLVIHGWQFFTYILAVIFGHFFGYKVAMRTDTPLSLEKGKPYHTVTIKKIFLKYVYFPLFRYLLFIGDENKNFLLHYGAPNKKLVFCPFSVDNKRFDKDYRALKEQKDTLKENLGIEKTTNVILFVGKYTEKKRVMQLIEAFKILTFKNTLLLMVGEGEKRPEIEAMIKRHGLKIILTGFKNQTELAPYYTVADVFVLPSAEQWGLAVNEAMNFGLPVIVSELVGCHANLVKEGENGFVFPCDDIKTLSKKMEAILLNPELQKQMRVNSKNIILDYSVQKTAESLIKLM